MSENQTAPAHPDYTKYPEGHEALLPMLDFLPDEESKYGLLAGFTMLMSLM